MADTLGSFLAGVNQGVATGLDLYKTVQSEARQNRLEQYQKQRDSVADQQWQSTYDRTVERDRVADQQWQQNFTIKEQEFGLAERTQQAAEKHQAGMRGIYARNQALDERKHQDSQNEKAREQRLLGASSVARNSLLGSDGQYITEPQALADKLNSSPDANRAFLTVAAETGMIDAGRAGNYSGGRWVVGPNGRMLLQVAGKDGTGKPIEGTAFLSENGTSDPNDPYVTFDPQALARMVDPQYNEALRSVALRDQQIAAYDGASQAKQGATTASLEAGLEAAGAQLAASEGELQRLRDQRAALPTTVFRGKDDQEIPNPAVTQLDDRIRTLSSEIEAGWQAQGKRNADLVGVAPYYEAQRGSNRDAVTAQQQLFGADYAKTMSLATAGAPAAAAKKRGEADKAFGSVLTGIVSRNAEKVTKDNPQPKVTQADLTKVFNNLPAELQARIGNDRRYQAAAENAAQHMARAGFVTDPQFLIEADAAGADLQAYTELVNSPQLAGMSDAERHSAAVQGALTKAQEPTRSLGAIMGSAFR